MDYRRHHNPQERYSPYSPHLQKQYNSRYPPHHEPMHGPPPQKINPHQMSGNYPDRRPRKADPVIWNKKRTDYRKYILFGCCVLVVLAGIAAGVTMYLLKGGDSEPGDCKVVSFTSTMSFTLMQFQSIFADKTSEEYQNFVNHFCGNLTNGLKSQMEMNQCAEQPTDHCQVSSLERGSVVVNFTVKQVVDSSKIKSDSAMEKEMQKAIENVVSEGRASSLSENNIFKQRTTQGEISVGEKVNAIQCDTLTLPENMRQLSSTSQTNLVGTTISWTCKTGYTFPADETTTSATCGDKGYWSYYPSKPCEDIDECVSEPCLNNATCQNGENGYNCTCHPAFTGTHCETKFDDCYPNPCDNGATCVDLGDEYQCECPAGFSGIHCEINVDDCSDPSLCQNGGQCVDGVDSYTCECPDGFIGTNCETDVDECSSNPCQNNATCVDDIDGYTCECIDGISGLHCESDIDECASSPCANDGTCEDVLGQFVCTCAEGWSGVDCSDDFDECLSDPCKNDGTCTDIFNGYECVCPDGYSGPECAVACANVSSENEILCLPFDLPQNNGFQTSTWTYITVNGGVATASSCGVKDKCVQYDGADDYLKIEFFHNAYQNYGSFSISFWFKRDSSGTGEMGLISNAECGSPPDETFFVSSSDSGKISAGVETDGGGHTFTDIDAADDAWHHIALVYNGTNINFFVDNVKDPLSPAASGKLTASSCVMTIAKASGATYFKGQMDEICVYGTGLSDEEVGSLYNQPTQCNNNPVP